MTIPCHQNHGKLGNPYLSNPFVKFLHSIKETLDSLWETMQNYYIFESSRSLGLMPIQ